MYTVGAICTRQVVTCGPDADLREAARLMRNAHVGSLVVVDGQQGGNRPVGIVTDRDLVVSVLALDPPIDRLRVADVMTQNPVTATESDDFFEAVRRMHQNGVRRVPVVNGAGHLVGLVAADDLFEFLLGSFGDLAALMVREKDRESRARPAL